MTQILAQQIDRLTAGGEEFTDPSGHRPLPRNQRRPQRLEPGSLEVKRSIRFGGPGAGAGPMWEDGESGPPSAEETDAPIFPLAPVLRPAPAGGDPGDGEIVRVVPLAPAVPFTPRSPKGTDGARETRRPGLSWAAAVGVSLVAGALGWFGHAFLWEDGRSPQPRPTPPPGAPGVVARAVARPDLDTSPATKEALRLLGLALRAEKKGQPVQATELIQQAQAAWPALPGAKLQLALLALQRNDAPQSRVLLDQLLAAGEQLGAAHNLRSAFLRAEGRTEEGLAELEAATRAEPLNAKSFYYWAEALRRIGRMEEAAERLQDALARTNDPMENDFYSLKLRLVRIDQDRENEFAEELTANLRRPEAAPTEWLLTAAALACKRGDYAVAAGHLSRAKERLSPAVASFLLSDQIFADQAWRKELAPLYQVPRPGDAAAAGAKGSAAQ